MRVEHRPASKFPKLTRLRRKIQGWIGNYDTLIFLVLTVVMISLKFCGGEENDALF